MIKQLLSFTILFSITISVYSQSLTSNKHIENNYSQYFELPRESIYLHFNKSQYVFGENIWFKGYVYDRKDGKPSTKTSNIYVGIYDKNDKQIKSNLFLGYEGFLRGSFQIDSTLTTGKYYIKAHTNWMKNFIENDAYITEIDIINEDEVLPETNIKTNNYDIQFLPESGHSLLGVKNNFGIKIINSFGEGVEIKKGKIINNNGIEVSTFETNKFGLGSVSVNYKKGETYTAILKTKDNQEIKKRLPKPESIGVNFNVINSLKDNIIISINKTSKTIDREFKILLHRDGKSKSFNAKLNNELNTNISISRDHLFDGVNIITLFNSNNQPIAERIFYNYNHDNASGKLQLTYIEKIDDSLYLNLSVPKHNSNYYNLSISVLPIETESYNHPDNIISNFKLLPYLKGNVESPKYYFTNIDREKKYDLDLLLLTQGWSRYSWKNIFNNKPKITHEFENGLSLNGKLNINNKRLNSLFLFPMKNNVSKLVELDQSKAFKVKNLFPETNELIKLSYVTSRDTKRKPKLNAFIINKKGVSNFNSNDIKHFSKVKKSPIDFRLNSLISENTVFLNEVLIKGKKEEVIKKERLENGRVVKIEEGDNRNYSLINIIGRNGFTARENRFTGNVTITTSGIVNTRGPESPLVLIDDVIVENLNILSTIPTEFIDEILFDKFGGGFGIRSRGGIIKIYTRSTPLPLINGTNRSPVFSIKTEKGFTPHKEFYNPRYAFYSTSTYKKHGVIHWVSDKIIKNEQGLKIPDYNQESVTFFIEGMSDTGDLISEIISIDVPDVK